ncbi:hypothetical protein Dalk_2614 [Desulfatibacillum aliphaticivorans]|uniref:Uncharacterized protein n=1 Tax=Desulfatibacillum aliphaticivorans TaxID=218208 RepID=B8FIR6_DESAL|nr:hypothetical protein [Desulfatibacillum aliphaticivorans]ACL04307.1 hypothetical protein Dalk_2614 [Desulfatibacillum aliphaticivorans]
MATRKKRNKKVDEKVTYEISVQSWDMEYSFGVNRFQNVLSGVYLEHPCIYFIGALDAPEIKQCSQVKVRLLPNEDLSNHHKLSPNDRSPEGVGYMEIPKTEDVLKITCHLPPNGFQLVATWACLDKIKRINVYGTKLRYRQGTVIDIQLKPDQDEDE